MSKVVSVSHINLSINAVTPATVSSDTVYQRRCVMQDFLLIWLNTNIDESTEDYQNMLAQLQSNANNVNIFTMWDEAVDLFTEDKDTKALLVVNGPIDRTMISVIHDIPQLYAIYILCKDESEHKQWINEWTKIKGVYKDIKLICETLQIATKQYNQDSIAMCFVDMNEQTSTINLDQLEPTFMYTQIFKEIFVEMEYTEQSFKDFLQFWRDQYLNNSAKLNDIAEFEHNYYPQFAIKWYTRECFIYQMLNRALRMLDADTLINMGFFLRDLHQQIKELHRKQGNNYRGKSFVVYRGQGLSNTDFDKLFKTKGGLISFNNFLSASPDRNVCTIFAESALGNIDTVGILFKMTVDPSISSTPFASVRDVSHFKTEEEILFSMHTIFRIGAINKINGNQSLYQVELELTADNDIQLHILAERIRMEVADERGWHRLGKLLIKLSQFNKADELYNILLKKTSDPNEKAIYFNQLGYIKNDQGNYEKAIEYFKRSLQNFQKVLSQDHPLLAASYNNIGDAHRNMGKYSEALSYYEEALKICRKIPSENHSSFAALYNNIGLTYSTMADYQNALLYHEKALEIHQKTLPSNHPTLATSYNNIGELYQFIGSYAKALTFYEQALDIRQRTLPPDHPDFATSHNNIGMLYFRTGEYTKALLSYEAAIQVRRKTLPLNHPSLAVSYNDIGALYDTTEQYLKALSFYEKALEIYKKTLPPNHPNLAVAYSNIGGTYESMGEYVNAVSFFEKQLIIKQKILVANHPDFAAIYKRIGLAYYHIGEYSKALSCYKNALEIEQNTLPSNWDSLATSYNNIGGVYRKIQQYSTALSFYEKAIQIFEDTPLNYSGLASSYNNSGLAYCDMSEYSQALSFHEKAREIWEKICSPDDPLLGICYNNIGLTYCCLKEYSNALLFYEQAVEIFEKCPCPNHPRLASSYSNIGAVYANMNNYSAALPYYERVMDIYKHSLPSDHPELKNVQKTIKAIQQKLNNFSLCLFED